VAKKGKTGAPKGVTKVTKRHGAGEGWRQPVPLGSPGEGLGGETPAAKTERPSVGPVDNLGGRK